MAILADQDDINVIAEFLKSRYLNHHYYTLRERERDRERERERERERKRESRVLWDNV